MLLQHAVKRFMQELSSRNTPAPMLLALQSHNDDPQPANIPDNQPQPRCDDAVHNIAAMEAPSYVLFPEIYNGEAAVANARL